MQRTRVFFLTVIALSCFLSVSADSQIYVSPSGTPLWDGNCDLGCSDPVTPCGLPSTTITATSAGISCIVNFLAGTYTTPVTINQVGNTTSFTAAFATTNGGVQGLSLAISSQSYHLTGIVRFGTVNMSLEAATRLEMTNLNSVASTFNFVGDSAPSEPTIILASGSTFSLVSSSNDTSTKDIVYLFNFNLPGPGPDSPSAAQPSFFLQNSNFQLTANYSGLIFSTGGSGPRSVSIKESNVTTPYALLTFVETTATVLGIMESNISSAANIFKSLHGIDATSFDSRKARLILSVSQSTVTGRSYGNLTQVYDPNACVDLTVVSSSVSFLDVNCNSPDAWESKYRCGVSLMDATMTDNRICVLTGSPDVSAADTVFIISTPTRAPVMTWIKGTLIKSPVGTLAFRVLPSSSHESVASTNDDSIPFLFSDNVRFQAASQVWFNGFTLDTNARFGAPAAKFDHATIKMRNGSMISPNFGNAVYWLNGHSEFSMDGAGSASFRADQSGYLSFQVLLDESAVNQTRPVLQFNDGVAFVAPSKFLQNTLSVNWDMQIPISDDAYPLISNAHFSDIDAGNRYRIIAARNLTAWIAHNGTNCGDYVCGLLQFGNQTFFPVGPIPQSPLPSPTSTPTSPTSTSPATAPTSSNPISAPIAKSPLPAPTSSTPTTAPTAIVPISTPLPKSECAGNLDLKVNGFVCVNSTWLHAGDLMLDQRLLVDSSASQVFIDGNVRFGVSGWLVLAGSNAGIKLSGCLYSPEKPVVILDYSAGWPNKQQWHQKAIVQSSSCNAAKDDIPYLTLVPKGCLYAQGVTVSQVSNGLYINWTLDKSGCPSTLAIGLGVGLGALALFVLGAVVVFICVRKSRANHDVMMTEAEPLINSKRGL